MEYREGKMDEENLYFIEEMERQIRPIQVPDCCSF